MSGPGGASQRNKGPREQRLAWLWGEIWKAYAEGQVYQYYLTQADADLTAFRQSLPQGDVVAAADLNQAEIVQMSQGKYFEATLAVRSDERAKFSALRQTLFEQVLKVSFSTMQLMALANGSAVLAALTYLGRDGASQRPPLAFVLVIVFGGLGFLTTLLASHVVVKMAMNPLGIMMDMTALHISEKAIQEKRNLLMAIGKRQNVWSQILGYSAAAFLIAAITAGTVGLAAPMFDITGKPANLATSKNQAKGVGGNMQIKSKSNAAAPKSNVGRENPK